MRYFINTYNIIIQLIRFNTLLNRQREYATKLLGNQLTHLNQSTRKKALNYAIYIPIFIGHSYTLFRNKKFTSTELECITLLGALTALFDDLFDTENYDYSKINQLLLRPIATKNTTDYENTLITIYNKILGLTTNKTQLIELALKIHAAQIESTKQIKGNLATQELITITYNKGGYSMLLYRTAFNEPITALEKELYYKIGAIGQLENDIFDIYKDLNDGIQTLAIDTKSIKLLRSNYNNLKKEIFSLVNKHDNPLKQKLQFKLTLILIIERGNVALNYYEKSTQKPTFQFQPQKLSKKQLICDMEKPINIVKLIHYAASCCKK